MLVIKLRLLFIEEFNDRKIDFLKAELIAVQLRKIIEAVAYACVCACEFGGEELESEVLDAYDARKIFSELVRRNLSFVPRSCVFKYKGKDKIEDWHISKNDVPRSAQIMTAKEYLAAYKKLHQYAHEFHPRRPHHLLHKDGLERATAILRPIKSKLSNSLWQHFIPFGNRALVIDFGEKDKKKPETFVFRNADGYPAWPLLYAIAEPRSK
jgi:hypothetical protein